MTEPLIPGGYILLSRKIIKSEIWYKPPLYLKVWVYLLSLAQHREYKKMRRGQLRTSIPEIIEACSWRVGARIERPSKDQIYQILNWLRNRAEHGYESSSNTSMITTTKATHGMLVTIDNYSFYQDPNNYEGNAESNAVQVTKPVRTPQQPDNTNKNVKNDKNDNIDDGKLSLENRFIQLRGKGLVLGPLDYQAIDQVIESGVSLENGLKWLDECFSQYKPKYSGDSISSFKYCSKYILDKHHREQQIPAPRTPDIDPFLLKFRGIQEDAKRSRGEM